MNMRNFKWTHLAAVPMGAYGEKAGLYGSCMGPSSCINQLVAGSVANLSERITYCPVGASIMLTSLLESNSNNFKMDANNSTATANIDPKKPLTSTANPQTSTAPINPPAVNVPKPGVIRLKTSLNQPGTGQEGNLQPANKDNQELESVKKMVEDMKLQQEQATRREQIKKLIPKELFIMKGKFDEKGYEVEVDKRLQSNWDDATIQEFYNGKLELLKFGFQFPKENQNPEGQNQNQINDPHIQTPDTPGLPTGGSTYSAVPDLMGGSAEDYTMNNVRQLLSRFVRSDQ